MRVPTTKAGVLGTERFVTDYIQVRSPKLRRIAAHLAGRNATDSIEAVRAYVAHALTYPLDFLGKNTAAHSIKWFKWWNGIYLHSHEKEYGWLFPDECLEAKHGICFDSSCLCTTLLRLKGVRAWTVLGMTVKTKTDKPLDGHAWTEAVDTDAVHVVIETTVHPTPGKLLLAKDVYTGRYPLLFDPCIWFNETEYREDLRKMNERNYPRLIPP